jgi:hypothetical protein
MTLVLPVYSPSTIGSPSGSVPTTLSSWLPNVEYHGTARPWLVIGRMAAPNNPGTSGKPSAL